MLGTAFTIALGVGGWLLLLAFPALGILPHDAPSGALSVALFSIVILAARALAFRPAPGRVLSLDSAYYVAAALCAGTLEAGTLVAIALTPRRERAADRGAQARDAARRWLARRARLRLVLRRDVGRPSVRVRAPVPRGRARRYAAAAGRRRAARRRDRGRAAVAHYTLQGIRHVLLGRPLRQYIEELALPGVVAEASLMPIGVVLVLLYDPAQPPGSCCCR